MIDIPCELDHVKRIDVQPAQLDQMGDFLGCPEVLPIYSRTLEHDGRPLACFGVMPLWTGVGQAWSLLSDEILKDHKVALCRAVGLWLSYIEHREQLHRVQAAVAVGHDSGDRWIRWLGFRHEGLMHNYGLGGKGDFHLYARVV